MEPNKVTESLKQLLIELQKVKDLNNMANEYKTISANLVLALQNYLNDNREFSNTFNEYLNQTNKSVKDTNNALEKAVGTINDAIQKMGLADGWFDSTPQISGTGAGKTYQDRFFPPGTPTLA